MEEKRSRAKTPHDPATPPAQSASELKGAALYLRWLGMLCTVMALFCLGVFAIGYKEPSFGRIATLIALIVASAACLRLSRRT
ncbi:hypothetical protein VJ918_10790 [Adlercreutzia sp. R21]|uniref:hypothetical protein n=1 Tax=Adlercreutzia wanghongyangiae TaxID=3111451 RepID=UPI002DBA8A45|nr:hypothetical protein [Adlercreutzia sp. R21]MEC4185295.1 hypothetical protein [Adlercreutzia sp. R21]